MKEYRSSKRVTAIKWVSMVVVALAFFIVQFHRNTPSVMRDELMAVFHMNATSFGLFSSMYFYPYMLAQIPVGMMLDALGARRTIGLCSMLAAVGAFIFGVSSVYPVACIGRILIGVGVAAPVISTQSFLLKWVGQTKAASYYGIFSFCGKLGGMCAQLPLAWLVAHLNWRTVFFLCAGVSLVIALLCFFLVKDSPEECLTQKGSRPDRPAPALKNLFRAMGKVFSNRRVWMMMVVMFIQQALYGLFSSTWAVPYLQDVFGLSKIEASSYTTLMLVGAMVFSLAVGTISDRLKSRRTVIAAVCVVMGLVWALLAFCGNAMMASHMMWPLMFLMGATGAGVQIMFAYSREMNDPNYVGVAVSSINMVGMLGSAVAPTVFGAMLDKWSAAGYLGADLYRRCFIPCIVLSVLALVLTLLSRDTGCRNCYGDKK